MCRCLYRELTPEQTGETSSGAWTEVLKTAALVEHHGSIEVDALIVNPPRNANRISHNTCLSFSSTERLLLPMDKRHINDKPEPMGSASIQKHRRRSLATYDGLKQ